MTNPLDAQTLAALREQHRELSALLGRLERARATMIPPPASFWAGHASGAYNSAVDAVTLTLEAGVHAARSAAELTRSAITEVAARG